MSDEHTLLTVAEQRMWDERRIRANAERPISQLSDRELLEEQVFLMRTLSSMLAEFSTSGMGKMFAGMLPGVMGSGQSKRGKA